MNIHPSAVVDSKAELADDVEVQAFSLVGPGVSIGAGTVVGPHCVIEGRTVIGKSNHFYSGAQVGIPCQDLKHDPRLTGRVEIGDGNMVREHVTISASAMSTEADEHRVTSVGSGCLLMAYSHVAHDCQVGDGVIMANCATLAGHVHVEEQAFIAGLSGVHQFCAVGRMAMVGALTAVRQDVAPYMIVDGNPARCCGPNVVKLRRADMTPEKRKQIKEMHRIMFRADLNTTQALHEIERSVEDSPERTHFLDFFRKSVRGVTK